MTSHMHEMLARIAVVEDDADLLDTMLEYLKIQGYPAWGVRNAEDFYRRFAADVVDVVVLDIGLPGEDGISVARHLRDLPDLTIIIVSARDALDDRLVGLKAGADRYLVKPVNLIELVANIEAVGRRPAHPATGYATGRMQ
ncbi:MAG: response regulator transcription factor [Gallionella sp.]|nr:response regulator transcription factor [Gallionella sp.]